jgi:hypothetical protein
MRIIEEEVGESVKTDAALYSQQKQAHQVSDPRLKK